MKQKKRYCYSRAAKLTAGLGDLWKYDRSKDYWINTKGDRVIKIPQDDLAIDVAWTTVAHRIYGEQYNGELLQFDAETAWIFNPE